MRRLLNIILKGVLPPFFVGWCLYFTGKSIYEYIYYRRLIAGLEREILYIKAKTAVRESRIAFLKTEEGKKIFLEQVHRSLEKE